MAFGFGKSKSRSSSSSSSFGASFGQTFIDPAQQPFLDFSRNLAAATTSGQLRQGGIGRLFGRSAELGQAGEGFLGQLTDNEFLDTLQRLSGGDQGLVGQQTEQLGGDIGRFLSEQALPGIRRGAVDVGGLGGTRQGVAEGIALRGGTEALARGSTQFQLADVQRQQQAATTGAGLVGQGAQAGLGGLGQLFGLAQAPFDAQFNPLLSLANIIGPSTALSQQQSLQRATAKSSGSSSGFNIAGF